MHLISLFMPLFISLYIGCFGRFLGRTGSFYLALSGILVSWGSCLFWFGSFKFISFGVWFSIGVFNIYWTLNFSSLSWVMYFVVITVASVVYCFSFYYLSNDPHLPRFFMYLLLFTFFMLFLVVGDNLLLVFWGWEGVGLCSFLLINFWYSRIAANKAALKAVFVNKVSDLFLFFGIILIINETNTAELPVFFSLIPFFKNKIIIFSGIKLNFLNLIALLFLGGVIGKSAQIGLHIWLPDAMEGPTPVSALIHAATMVTAGVFLVIRFSLLFEYCPKILKIILFLGCLTAFMSALIGSFQYDVKKIIAYSSIIHMNYLMFGLFSANIEGLVGSLILMVAHGFISGGLFACVGILYDRYHTRLQKPYGGLNYFMPIFSFFFLIFTLANISFPGSINFIGEFLVLLGVFFKNILIAFFVMFIMILSTCYALWLYNKIFSGLIIAPID